MSELDPISAVKAFDAAWNAHDLEAVMAFFTDSAIVRLAPPPPDGGIFSGRSQIRAWAEELLPGFHVESMDHCATGDQVTWNFHVSSDSFQAMGVSPVTGRANALVRRDKIHSLTVTFDEQMASRMGSP